MHSLVHYLQGWSSQAVLSAERQRHVCQLSPPPHYVQIKGLFGFPSKPSGRGHGAMFVARAPEVVPSLLSLGIRPSGNTGPPACHHGPTMPHPGCLAGLRRLAGRESWVVLGSWGCCGAGQWLLWALGMQTRSLRQACYQGHYFYFSDTSFLYVLVKTHTYKKIPRCC